jgi:hypothetical protein
MRMLGVCWLVGTVCDRGLAQCYSGAACLIACLRCVRAACVGALLVQPTLVWMLIERGLLVEQHCRH